mmetsp:Transcript_15894/g.42378  ORF Transcript_15894/g.42378 Transcript_15894/m.42378 type:complete len:349 (+) Transcript_15894:82-1128(+)
MADAVGEVELLFGPEVLQGARGGAAAVVREVWAVEAASYPQDEAASLEALEFRMSHAPQLFLVAFTGREVVGFVCGTRGAGDRLEEESLSRDDPQGKAALIHSVCVREDHRGAGLATRLLAAYVARLRDQELELAVLCCKAPLREFYRRAGFGCVGLSAFVHGRDPWWDMKMVLAEEDLLFGQALLKGVKGDVGQLVSTVLSIEVASYPADEAATLESLTFRMTEVPELFLVAYEGAEIVGYICGTRGDGDQLTEEALGSNVPDGRTALVHSVCVRPGRRGRGLAARMLARYVESLRAAAERGELALAMLCCKENLKGLYLKAGFSYAGPSAFVHGQDPWHDMKMTLA